ncbi:MAG TPA: DNA translocase FtsK [Kiritimatiellia bacterium]|nr:DNA translocase FtsK [Kiritimatiellia bacterium]HQQ04568.1 DNA translocase FtsK [Kiritimatiellia bacterium]
MSNSVETESVVWRGAWGFIFLGLGIILMLSLISWRPGDLSLIQDPPNEQGTNLIGPAGAWMAFAGFGLLGVTGYLLPVVLWVQALFLFLNKSGSFRAKALYQLVVLLSLACIVELQPDLWEGLRTHLNIFYAGGLFGHLLATAFLVRLLGVAGCAIVAVCALLTALVLLFEIEPVQTLGGVGVALAAVPRKIGSMWRGARDRRAAIEEEERELERQRRQLEKVVRRQERRRPAPVVESEPEPEPVQPPSPPREPRPPRREKPRPAPVEPPGPSAADSLPSPTPQYTLPAMTLLDRPPPARDRQIKENFSESARILQETLADFGIEAEVTNVERGPVVTRFEVLPAAGVRVERISALSNNIALAMKAVSIRVQAPIPGKGVVGIEVPNSSTTLVYLRELLEGEAWQKSRAGLPLAMGKDVGGNDIVADLSDMPHMLIAGATGSGKTVCMNSLLAGLLMSRTPDQLRLMLVDPKIVEFSFYNELPHLVVPVITDPKKVGLGLRWAIMEMEKRYKLFAKAGVRNIASYNSRPKVTQEELFEEAAEPADNASKMPDRLPYIVIVVDELADLMMVAQAEVENYIARLAQLSRATGIHMILATQRPSVNVITGSIKANIPARIAFQVAQRNDSRTILDANGADKLLGKGDMLFLSPKTGKLVRAQGTMTSDSEIRRIVDCWKEQGRPQYETAIKEQIENKKTELPEMNDDDELLDPAIEIIRQTRRASTSSLQRRLRIGYTRAARLMDVLEEKGIIGPPNGSDPREILIDLDGEIPQNPDEDEEMDD